MKRAAAKKATLIRTDAGGEAGDCATSSRARCIGRPGDPDQVSLAPTTQSLPISVRSSTIALQPIVAPRPTQADTPIVAPAPIVIRPRCNIPASTAETDSDARAQSVAPSPISISSG